MKRYTKRMHVDELRTKYDHLIGWGAGKDEFLTRYNPSLYRLDYMIDGKDNYVGEIRCGMKISSKAILKELVGRKICFVIYPHAEDEIVQQIREYIEDFDIIVSKLLDYENPITL